MIEQKDHEIKKINTFNLDKISRICKIFKNVVNPKRKSLSLKNTPEKKLRNGSDDFLSNDHKNK